MTLGEIKALIMFQTSNDVEDVGDFLPSLLVYINDGYDRLALAYADKHVTRASENYPSLAEDVDEPNLPEWTHKGVADWATWLVYKNGNPNKQQRGMAFRYSADEILKQIALNGGLSAETKGKITNFSNIPI